MEQIDDVLHSIISRVVAGLVPVLSGMIAAALLWFQNVIGIDLQVDPAAAAAFVGSVALGGCLVGLKWLEGRAKYEAAAAEIWRLHNLGDAEIGPTPIVPPGLRK